VQNCNFLLAIKNKYNIIVENNVSQILSFIVYSTFSWSDY